MDDIEAMRERAYMPHSWRYDYVEELEHDPLCEMLEDSDLGACDCLLRAKDEAKIDIEDRKLERIRDMTL